MMTYAAPPELIPSSAATRLKSMVTLSLAALKQTIRKTSLEIGVPLAGLAVLALRGMLFSSRAEVDSIQTKRKTCATMTVKRDLVFMLLLCLYGHGKGRRGILDEGGEMDDRRESEVFRCHESSAVQSWMNSPLMQHVP